MRPKSWLIALTCFLSGAGSALAAPPAGAVLLGTSERFQISTVSGVSWCGRIDAAFVPGSMVQEYYFYPYSLQRSALKKKLAVATGAKRLRLQKRLLTTRKKLKESKGPCASGPSGGGGGGFPTLCYDGFGNLSAAGKAKYQVPEHLSGSISSGAAIYQSFCAGCHEERPRSFPVLRHEISQEPMYFSSSEIPDAALANLVAYLQRFTTLCS